MAATTKPPNQIAVIVVHHEPQIKSLITSALTHNLSKDSVNFLDPLDPLPEDTATIQWRAYEDIDFEHALFHHSSEHPHLINSYIIRKALIRKHYLAHTVSAHVTKHPSSILKSAFPLTLDFELDYAEFLDEALIEAFELHESFQKNQDKSPAEKEWWMLKPSMSDQGQGIRLFSSEDELRSIFEAWEAEMPLSDEELPESEADGSKASKGIVTSHLRHFVVQKYVDSPLLFSQSPYSGRKFHIRTYVVAAGALKVYVWDRMLALFASEPYEPPASSERVDSSNDTMHSDEPSTELLLRRMQRVHLTNTCIQTSDDSTSSQEHVFLLSQLPLTQEQHALIYSQILRITSDLFSAATAHPTNFQPLPQAFEFFGIDFLVAVDEGNMLGVHLLEVNAFPDFNQTSSNLMDEVVGSLFAETVDNVISPLLPGSNNVREQKDAQLHLKEVLDLNLGRR